MDVANENEEKLEVKALRGQSRKDMWINFKIFLKNEIFEIFRG